MARGKAEKRFTHKGLAGADIRIETATAFSHARPLIPDRRPFGGPYRSFIDLVGRTVGSALDAAYRRSEELGVQQTISQTLQAAMLSPASDLPTVAARYRPASGHLAVGGDWYS